MITLLTLALLWLPCHLHVLFTSFTMVSGYGNYIVLLRDAQFILQLVYMFVFMWFWIDLGSVGLKLFYLKSLFGNVWLNIVLYIFFKLVRCLHLIVIDQVQIDSPSVRHIHGYKMLVRFEKLNMQFYGNVDPYAN